MGYLRQVFTAADISGNYLPYFNISDDAQVSSMYRKLPLVITS